MVCIVKLHGGLGNQLFQYAIGIETANANPSISLKFDTSFFSSNDMKFPRKLTLEEFVETSEIPIVGAKNTTANTVSKIFKRLNKKFDKLKFLTPLRKLLYGLNIRYGNIIDEIFLYGYNKTIVNRLIEKQKKDDILILNGYWCDTRYFSKVLPLLKNKIKIKSASTKFLKLKESINTLDVCLHIRRGDYLTIGNNPNGIVLDMNYYLNAVKYTYKHFDKQNLTCWVFTDDYIWCKENLANLFPNVEFKYCPENLNDAESFELMRYFRIIIGANSTFSLWASYLSYNENLLSIFPNKWLKQYRKIGFNLRNPYQSMLLID